MSNANPAGLQRWGELRLLAPLARAFTVHRVGRPVGLEPGTTMEDLANGYAGALGDEFGGPVDVLGISTGGSLALQLAADRPGLVRRLVVAGAAYRLSEHGRAFQRRVAELSAAGDRGAGCPGCRPPTSRIRPWGDASRGISCGWPARSS
jgi:pimeloyl-ACP methyl ester carboxylesterase